MVMHTGLSTGKEGQSMMDDMLQDAVWLQDAAQYFLKRHSDYETVRSNAGYYMYLIVLLCAEDQIYNSPNKESLNECTYIYDAIRVGKTSIEGFIIPEELEKRLDKLQEWADMRYDPYFVPPEDEIVETFSIVTEYLEMVKKKEENVWKV